MSNHLSEDQVSRGVIGLSTAAELEHIHDCVECAAGVERFRESLSLFRSAVRDRADRQIVSAVPRRHSRPTLRWAVAVAAVVVLVITIMPTYRTPNVPDPPVQPAKATTNEDVLLMEAISAHLSRVVPAPMEPVMALLPESESGAVQGGVR